MLISSIKTHHKHIQSNFSNHFMSLSQLILRKRNSWMYSLINLQKEFMEFIWSNHHWWKLIPRKKFSIISMIISAKSSSELCLIKQKNLTVKAKKSLTGLGSAWSLIEFNQSSTQALVRTVKRSMQRSRSKASETNVNESLTWWVSKCLNLPSIMNLSSKPYSRRSLN